MGAFGSSTVDASGIPFGSKIQSVVVSLTTTDGAPNDEYYLLVAPTSAPNNANTQNLMFMGGVGGGSSFNGTIRFADGNPSLPDTAPTTGSTYEPSANANTGSSCTNPSVFCNTPTFSTGAPGTIHYAPPFGTATFSSQFLGASPTGTWTLYGYGAANDGSTATVSGWSISIVAAVGAPTNTTVSITPNAVFTSGTSSTATITATVTSSPTNPTDGTVAFTDNGATISGCASVALNSSSQATCVETFTTSQEGTHIISATYTDETIISFVTSTGTKGLQVDNVTTNPTGGQYCNTGTIAVPGVLNTVANPYPSHVYVPLTSAISSVTLTMSGFTTPGGDAGTVNLMLVAPDDTPFVPMNHVDGQTGETAITAAADGSGFTLSDAGTAFPSGGALSNTSYQPLTFVPAGNWPASMTVAGPPSVAAVNFASAIGNGTFGTAFNGKVPNGTGDNAGLPWSLYIVSGLNLASSPTAVNINGWCLNFGTSSAALTNTVLQSGENPSFVGDSVTFTAKVTSGASPVTQGAVTFFVDGNSVQSATALSADGTATYAASALAEGTHTVQAFYSGSGTTLAVSNATLSEEVDHHTVISNNNRTFCNPGSVSIPSATGPATPYPSKIFVTKLPGTVQSVTTNLNNYTIHAPETVDTMLVGPTNTDLVFMSHIGGTTGSENSLIGANLTFADSALLPAPSIGLVVSGTYRASAYVAEASNFPAPAPVPAYAGPEGSATFSTQFSGIIGNGTWELFALQDETKTGNSGSVGNWCLNFTTNPVSISVNVSHNGAGVNNDFAQGQMGAQITVRVTNNGPGPTGDTLSVTDTLNNGLTLTGTSGTDWNCSAAGQVVTCTNSDVVTQGASYPTLTLTVNASPAEAGTFTNSVTVGGGGSSGQNASDTITVDAAPVLTVSKTHTGSFVENQTAEWDIMVSNEAANGQTAGVTNVQDVLATGYTLSSFSGNSWSCSGTSTVNCTSSELVAAGTSFPLLRLFVNVPGSSPASVSNTAGAWGGGDLHHVSPASATQSNIDSVSVTPSVQIIVATSVSGPTVMVDGGTPFTGSQTFTWMPGSPHTIATTTPQSGTTGTQYVWLNWSDGGAISHPVSAPSTNTTYTANFQTQYLLTTAVSPSSADGSISPATGFFAAGSVVPVSAMANSGFSFTGFSGALSGTATPQNVTLNGPVSETANFSTLTTNLTLTTTSKAGAANARVWSFNVGNTGPGSASAAQMTSFALHQTGGAACTPVVVTPFPMALGNLGPGTSVPANVTIDFSSCAASARFTLTVVLSANAGATTVTVSNGNQFQ